MQQELIEYLEEFITPERNALFDQVIQNRTRHITVALEDIFQPQNASAVLRTSDCFGVQDVHIIENEHEYRINPDVALGSSKWIDMIQYNETENNTLAAIKALKKKGYRIVATTPHTNDVDLEDFDITAGKTALFFGTELKGLSQLMLDNADEFLKIPMFGFTESFNISVSAAIILNRLTEKLRASDLDWQLSKTEQQEVKLNWLRQSIKRSEEIEQEFYRRKR